MVILDIIEFQPSIPNSHHAEPPFSLPEIMLFLSPSPSSPSHSSSDDLPTHSTWLSRLVQNPTSTLQNLYEPHLYISPEPYIFAQFYTFTLESYLLMICCILENRLATPSEIHAATSRSVLKSWRTVWKDRKREQRRQIEKKKKCTLGREKRRKTEKKRKCTSWAEKNGVVRQRCSSLDDFVEAIHPLGREQRSCSSLGLWRKIA
uniref:Uncharacterized protein n=1 Tax=Cucumis melo TaxID=3656 RepID=A0A9I9DB57_CUCME